MSTALKNGKNLKLYKRASLLAIITIVYNLVEGIVKKGAS